MKNENNILEFRIYGRTILLDYNKEEIVFPDNIREEEIEEIAWYLKEEGFLDSCLLNNNN